MDVLQVNPKIAQKLLSTVNATEKSFPLTDLKTGQLHLLKVVEKLSQNEYLLKLKDITFKAVSDIPLKKDENIQVKVQSVQPQVIFNTLSDQKTIKDIKIQEGLIQWRIHPDALVLIFDKFPEILNILKSVQLPPNITSRDIDDLIILINKLIFSPQTKTDKLFVKNFVRCMGMFLESDLELSGLKASMDSIHLSPANNLKAFFLKLLNATTNALLNTKNIEPQVLAAWRNLNTFSSEVLQMIESKQIVNVVYQENHSGIYLQIPFIQGKAFHQADVFITPEDKNVPGGKKYASCSIVIMLNMDYLGEIAINASLRQGRIRCVIKCENDDIKQILSLSLDQLKRSLNVGGYEIEQINCLKVSELAERRREFMDEHIHGSIDLINRYV